MIRTGIKMIRMIRNKRPKPRPGTKGQIKTRVLKVIFQTPSKAMCPLIWMHLI